MDAYIGEIRIFCGTYAPMGWVFCLGQSLQIAQYPALYSIIDTTYGGDGKTTFGLPNLQGRVPVGVGAGPGLSTYTLGKIGGNIEYTAAVLSSHSHSLNGTSHLSTQETAQGAVLANTLPRPQFWRYSNNNNPDAPLAAQTVASAGTAAGGGTPVSNMQPYLPLNFIICTTEGAYPVRP